MKKEEAPKRMYLPRPFAGGSSSVSAEVAEIKESSDSSDINFVDGFPAAYSTPVSTGGILPTRGQINAIGKMASVNEFARACGGIVTFDQKLANEIGGYPKYAVLEYLVGANYYRVISLVDDNFVDFTGSEVITDSTKNGYIADNSCVTGSVDGTHWAYCEQGFVSDALLVGKVADFSGSDYSAPSGATYAAQEIIPIGSFVALCNGVLTISGGCTCSKTTSSSSMLTGMVIVCTEGTNGPEESGAKTTVIYQRGNQITHTGWENSNVTVKTVTKGTRYSLFVVNAGFSVSNSTLEIRISE